MKIKQADIGTKIPFDADRKLFPDDDLAGFYLRSASDRVLFVIQYRIGQQQRRMTIGDSQKLSLAQARATARILLAKVKLGVDVAGERQAARAAPMGKTFGELAPMFLEARAGGNAPRRAKTLSMYKTALINHCEPFHDRQISSLTPNDIRQLMDALTRKVSETTAGAVFRALSSFWSWSVKSGHVEPRPLLDQVAKPAPPAPRDRLLSDTELRAIWQATEGRTDDWSRIVRLLMLSGQRRDQITGLRWDEIDLETGVITFQADRMKGGLRHKIPLTPMMREVIESVPRRFDTNDKPLPFVFGESGQSPFSGCSRAQDRLRALLPEVGGWVIHDFRRAFKSHCRNSGVCDEGAEEALLAHVKSGIKKHYDLADNMRGKTHVLEVWQGHLRRIFGLDHVSNIVAFGAAL